LPEFAAVDGRSSRLIIFLGSGIAEELGLGGTSTWGITGRVAGEVLSFFFCGLFPATLLLERSNVRLSIFRDSL
jgi:hypothetical protein